jgi:hypothetical protein
MKEIFAAVVLKNRYDDILFGPGGRSGIRTHGGLPHARFRVECLKPDSATLPKNGIIRWKRRFATKAQERYSTIAAIAETCQILRQEFEEAYLND